MKGILSRVVSLSLAVMMIVSLMPGVTFTVSAATAIGDTPLVYFDSEEFTEMGAGLPKMPMTSMPASGFANKGTDPSLLDTETKVYGYGGRGENDAAVKMQFKQGAVAKDEEWSLAAFSIDQNSSKGNFTEGTTVLTFVDMATSGEQDANILRDFQLGVFSVTDNKTVWPTVIEMAADGNMKFAGASDANFKFEPKTWYRFAIELYGGTTAYSAWMEGEQGWEQIVDHAYYAGKTDPDTGENNTVTSGLRIARMHLKAKQAGAYGDLYTDNFAIYADQAFSNELANAVSDAADLQFADFKGENESADSVTKALDFGVTGKKGSPITFDSDNTAVIAENGMVTPAAEETVVTLTATVGEGGNANIKTFKVTVPAKEEPTGILLTDDFGADRTDEITAKMEPTLLEAAEKLTLHNLVSKDLINTPDKVLCQVLAGTNKADENITFGYKLDEAVGDVRITMTGQLAMNGTGPGNSITAVQLSADGQSWTQDLKAGSGLYLSTNTETMYLDPDYDAVELTKRGLSGNKTYTNPKAEAWAEYTLSLSADGKAAVEKLGGNIKYVRVKFIKGGKLWKGAIRKIDILPMPELPSFSWDSSAKITASEVTQTGAKLTWNAAGEEMTYRVTLTGGEKTVVETADTAEIVLADLAADTEYSVSIDAVHNTGWTVSAIPLTGNFKTEAESTDPEESFDWGSGAAITAENITQTEATLSWPAVTAENVSYKVTRTGGSNEENVQTVAETGITYSDLTADTDYNISIDVVQEDTVKSSAPLTGSFKTKADDPDPDPSGRPLLLKDTFTEDRTEAPDAHVYAPFTKGGPLKMWDVSSHAGEPLGKAMRGSIDAYTGDFEYGYEFGSFISDFEATVWCGMNANGKDPAFTGSFILSTEPNGGTEVTLSASEYTATIVKEFDDFRGDGAMLEVELTLNDSGKEKIAAQSGLKYWKYSTNRSRHWAGIFREVRIYGYDGVDAALQTFDFTETLTGGDTVEHVVHDLNLPADIDGYRVSWQSSNESLIGADGKYHTEGITNGYYGGEVTLTVAIYENPDDAEPAATRDFTIQIYKNTDGWTGDDFINYDLTQFTDADQITAPQPASALAVSMTEPLPSGVEGGSTFSWSIKEETEYAAIDEKGKLVITQKLGEDVPLTLVLTAAKDGATQTREYPINIIKSYGTPISDGKIEVSSGSGKDSVKRPGFGAYWASTDEDTKPYIQYNLSGSYSFMTVILGEVGDNVQSFRLMSSDDEKNWTTVYTGTTLGHLKQIAIPLTQQKPQFFRAEFTSKAGTTVKIGQFLLLNVALTDEQIIESTFNLINLPRSTSTDLDLLTEGINGAVVSWQSSNTSMISNTGKVTRSTDESPTVTMTATVTYNEKSESRDYPVIVLKKSEETPKPVRPGGGSGGGGGGGLPYVPGNENPVQPNENENINQNTPYKDVSNNHWAYGYIKTLTDKKVVSGSGDGYFYPENSVTREEFLKMILSAANIQVSNEAVSFADVDGSAWYAPYVATAYKLGIVKGIDENRFGIGENIQRQDMAVMADRMLALMEKEAEGTALDYNDKAEISDYAVSAVENLAALEIMNGDENQNFLPRASATRAESAKIVCVMSELAE